MLDVLPEDHGRQDRELELLTDGYRSPFPERLQWRAWAANPEGLTGEGLMAFVNDELFPNLKEPSELLEKNATPAVLH